jgi:hypothetical protein
MCVDSVYILTYLCNKTHLKIYFPEKPISFTCTVTYLYKEESLFDENTFLGAFETKIRLYFKNNGFAIPINKFAVRFFF